MGIALRVGLRLCVVCALAGGAAGAQTDAPAPLRPSAVAYDAAGNLYFADTDRNQVYEATLAGGLVVVAGNGTQGSAGDGGAATAAELNGPQGVAIGTQGELYIADTGNARIRVVQAGVIATFAGNGAPGFSGDGGLASAASLRMPTALAVDGGGALLVCDTGNARLRRIRSGSIQTIAGSGVQGFSGDGGPATAAALDGPRGVAVASDGRIFVADSRNHRIRVIDASGTIGTYAGTGARGFAGDGGAATAALLNLPRGLVLRSDGTLVFADSDNRRVRAIGASGTITTIAGSGTQGASADGTLAVSAWLNAPRPVGVSSFGDVTLADSAAHGVQAAAADARVYGIAALRPARTSSVTASGPASATYGQWSAKVSVSGGASTPQGRVQLLEASSGIAEGALSAGSATIPAPALAAGPHTLTAMYAGDGINPAATGSATAVTISPATVTATASPASVAYGQAIPALAGTLSGVLAQDAGRVQASFTTTATPYSPVGTYAIAATLSGPAAGNYALAAGASAGTLTIVPAGSTTALPAQVTGSYAGLPMVLRAVVGSTTAGTPTGTVRFTENGATVAQATLTGGLASAAYASPATGTHSIVAAYGGDANFQASQSSAQSFVVLALPDFAVTPTGAASQTVAGGSIASYTLTVGAQPGPFTGAVQMSVSGLPAGAVASFSPPAVTPGAGSATTVLNVTTPVHAEVRRPFSPVWALAVLPGWWLSRRRRGRALVAWMLAGGVLCFLAGCGARTVTSTSGSAAVSSTLTVTGTATNLAGAVVTHSSTVTLVVE